MSSNTQRDTTLRISRYKNIFGLSKTKPKTRLIRFVIHKCGNLVPKDNKKILELCCKIILTRDGKRSKVDEVRTRPVRCSTSNPVWNEEFVFRVDPSNTQLSLQLLNLRSDRLPCLGTVQINLSHIEVETETAPIDNLLCRAYLLRSQNSDQQLHSRGSILIYIAYYPTEFNSYQYRSDFPENFRNPLGERFITDPALLSQPLQLVALMEIDQSAEMEEPLPDGWDSRIDQNGRVYFVDHVHKRTQWDRPHHAVRASGSSALDQQPQVHQIKLPEGWEQLTDRNGRVYYVDHVNKKTTWRRPKVEDLVMSQQQVIEEENGEEEDEREPREEQPGPSMLVSEEDPGTDMEMINAMTMYNRRHVISERDVQTGSPTNTNNNATDEQPTQQQTEAIEPSAPPMEEIYYDQDGEALPPGWQMTFTAQGKPFFIDHTHKITSWVDPRKLSSSRVEIASISRAAEAQPREDPEEAIQLQPTVEPNNNHAEEESVSAALTTLGLKEDAATRCLPALGPLPNGWQERIHSDGRLFYVDHINRKTQWEDPRLQRLCGLALPYSRNYKHKYDYFRSHLKKPRLETAKLQIKVNRETIFSDSYRIIKNAEPEQLRHKLWVEFVGDKGVDYGGPQREWFFLLSHEMLNPYYGLFEYSAVDNYTLQINPLSKAYVPEDHLKLFTFVGRVVGMAVYHGRLVDGFFIRPFYKMMLDKPITLKDMESVDADYYRSLIYILKCKDVESMHLTFAMDEEEFGEVKQIELCPGGARIAVTSANKKDYIDKLIQRKFVSRVELQMRAFKTGFNEVVPLNELKLFDENELELLICGLQDINVNDWKKNTVYKGDFHENHPVIINFWKAVYTFTNELRSRLLQFTTGTSRVPMNGFAELWGSESKQNFTITSWGKSSQLPRSHTCFNRLDLPPYQTFEELRANLIVAIENTEGFEGVD